MVSSPCVLRSSAIYRRPRTSQPAPQRRIDTMLDILQPLTEVRSVARD